MNFTLQLAKDFSTTATDASVDAISADLNASFTMNRKVAMSFGAGWGTTQFLGENGRVVISPGPPLVLGGQRKDSYGTWSASATYGLNDHLRTGITYSWFQNWSTTPFADFIRKSWNLNLSSRW